MNKLIVLLSFSLAIAFLSTNCVAQSPQADQGISAKLAKRIEAASKQTNLLMPSPPLGYVIAKQPLVIDETFVGFNVVMQKEGVVDKVLIRVDLREEADFSVRGFRSGGLKGYVNGMVAGLTSAGYRVVKRQVPDIDKSDLKKETIVAFEFKNEDDKELFLHQRIFFDTRGFAVCVIADSEKELESLKGWASKVQAFPIKKQNGQ